MTKIERCCKCDSPTGKAGAGDDSLYTESDGPFCEDCFASLAAPSVASGAPADEIDTRTEQIRLAHASAQPKDSNPAWKNSHRDCAVLLSHIALLKGEVERQRSAIAASQQSTPKASEINGLSAETARQVAGPNAQLVAALKGALEVIQDYLDYDHDGDPWKEDARLMGEMDINDYERDGRLEAAKAALAAAGEGEA